jgi:hypothetical protein
VAYENAIGMRLIKLDGGSSGRCSLVRIREIVVVIEKRIVVTVMLRSDLGDVVEQKADTLGVRGRREVVER